MKNFKIILHIGIQRTGTTFLQNNIFPNLDNIQLVNLKRNDGIKYNVIGEKNVQNILTDIHKYNNSTIKTTIIKYFRKEKINLISNENIYCNMWEKRDARLMRIKKIHEIFPNAKIILGIRKKQDLLISWYKKYIVNGGVLDFQEFKEKIINLDKLDYNDYINSLYNYYNDNNVFIYHFNDIKKNSNNFVRKISEFIGTNCSEFQNSKWNIGYSHWQLKVALLLNNLYKTPFNQNGLIPLDYEWHLHRILFQSPLFPKKLRGRNVKINDIG